MRLNPDNGDPERIVRLNPDNGDPERIVRLNPDNGDPEPLGLSAAADLTTFLLGQAAPYAGVLIGGQGELQAVGAGNTRLAHRLGQLDLLQGQARAPNGKEQVGIGVAAGRIAPPLTLVAVQALQQALVHHLGIRIEQVY